MRRRLIKQDAFDKIVNESVSAVKRELVAAEPILAKAVDKTYLRLKSFTESTVLYESAEDTFVHAGYEVKNGQLTFNNVEELVVDEESQKEKRKTTLSEMIDAVLIDNNDKANELFDNYVGMIRWNEAKKKEEDSEDEDEDMPAFLKKKSKKEKKLPAFLKNKKKKASKKHDEEEKKEIVKKIKKSDKDLAEAYVTSQNVLEYVEFMKVGPSLAESTVKTDENGNLTNIKIPTSKVRNENRMLRSDWKGLNAKVAETRNKVAGLVENQEFCKAVAVLKRQNAFADAQGLEEALEVVVQQYPEVLYATQSELAEVVKEALEVVGATNFDDKVCEFMAEGILRKAHDAYSEKVSQVLHLASANKVEEGVDPYSFFQSVVEKFYPSLDEKFGLERKVFSDLYESLEVVYKKAERKGVKSVMNETASYLNDLAAVLNNEVKPTLEIAEETAEYLALLIETNLESGIWVVSNKPHETLNGDHPEMSKKAAHGYAPSKDFSGDYGDPLPAVGSDDMRYKGGKHSKEMRNKGMGQEGGNDVFPSLKNPYVPTPFGTYTMKGEKGVDKDKGDLLSGSKDTFPNLKNPYVPKEEVGTGGKGYKMNHGKEKDLVVDK